MRYNIYQYIFIYLTLRLKYMDYEVSMGHKNNKMNSLRNPISPHCQLNQKLKIYPNLSATIKITKIVKLHFFFSKVLVFFITLY